MNAAAPANPLWASLAKAALIPLTLVSLALWLGSEYRRLGVTNERVNQVYLEQLVIQQTISAMKDAETGQRGYVITNDRQFLTPYLTGPAQAKALVARLKRFPTMQSAEDQGRIDRIANLIDAKNAEMARIVAAHDHQGPAAAAARISAGYGKRLMDELRREVNAIGRAHWRRVNEQVKLQAERTRTTQSLIWVAIGALTLIALVFGYGLWRVRQDRLALARKADEAAARQQAIFDRALDAIVLINPSGGIETMNAAASRLFGYPQQDLIRRDISLIADLAPGEGPFLTRLGLGRAGLAQPFRPNIEARRSDGRRLPVEVALGMMPLPDGIHIVAAFRDISDREKVERLKDQFLSTVSHELRTPLTSIVGSLGLLKGGAAEALSPQVLRLVTIAENNASRLIRLVNDLLDIEKLESGAMSFDFAPVDMRDVAELAVHAVQGMADNKGMTLILDLPDSAVTVRGDKDRLVQVTVNLLSNAVRFSPAGEAVRLSLALHPGEVELSVRDKGPGIDDELRERLFTRFAQSLRARSEGASGTGLGLAISRQIIHRHEGSIGFQPAPGGGSIFAFRLRRWNALTRQPDFSGALRVLIHAPEDEANAVAALLDDGDLRVDVLPELTAALTALDSRGYDLLIADGGMAAIHELAAALGDGEVPSSVPIIGLRSKGEGGEIKGVSRWVERPIDGEALNRAVRTLIHGNRSVKPLVLHVDDDGDTLELAATALSGRARMAGATSLAAARAFVARERPALVVIDIALPDGSGHDLIDALADLRGGGPPVIIYSAQDSDTLRRPNVIAMLAKTKGALPRLVDTVLEALDPARAPPEGAES